MRLTKRQAEVILSVANGTHDYIPPTEWRIRRNLERRGLVHTQYMYYVDNRGDLLKGAFPMPTIAAYELLDEQGYTW